MSINFALRKTADGRHIVETWPADNLYIQLVSYGESGNSQGRLEYLGFATPGTTDEQPKWFIKKYFYDSNGNVTAIKFANGTVELIAYGETGRI